MQQRSHFVLFDKIIVHSTLPYTPAMQRMGWQWPLNTVRQRIYVHVCVICQSLKKPSAAPTVAGPLKAWHGQPRPSWQCYSCTAQLMTGLNVQLFSISFVSIWYYPFYRLHSSYLSVWPILSVPPQVALQSPTIFCTLRKASHYFESTA